MTAEYRRDPLKFYLDKSNDEAWRAVGALSSAAEAQATSSGLDKELIELVCLRVSQINGCAFCLNAHTRRAVRAGVSPQRLGLLPAWQDAGVYSEQEKAALRLAEAVTTLPDAEERDFAQMISHGQLTDEQFAAVHWLAIVMNVTNRVSIMSHHPVRPNPAPREEK